MTTSATVSLDWECWDHKPSATLQYGSETDKYGNPKTEVRVLGARLGTETSDVTPKQLARAVLQGRTWSPFVFRVCPDWKRPRRIEDLFLSCGVLGVDYDAGISAQDILSHAESLGVQFNILHHSFSSTPDFPKYRGIVFLESEVTDLQKAKLYATGLAYGLNGDKSCVDVARLYFGSLPDCVVHLDNDSRVSLNTLQDISDSVSASKYIVSRGSEPKPYDPDWGTVDDQRLIFSRLAQGKRDFVRRKVGGILKEIETFDGSDGTSRYECVWKKTSRIARMPETVGNVIRDWVLERIEKNPYFSDWDKDPDEVVRNAIAWSFDHAEPPV